MRSSTALLEIFRRPVGPPLAPPPSAWWLALSSLPTPTPLPADWLLGLTVKGRGREDSSKRGRGHSPRPLFERTPPPRLSYLMVRYMLRGGGKGVG